MRTDGEKSAEKIWDVAEIAEIAGNWERCFEFVHLVFAFCNIMDEKKLKKLISCFRQ